MSEAAAWLDYRVRWPGTEAHPGRHATRYAGAGGALAGFRPFWQLPDARHVDVRRSVLDPFGQVMVRQATSRGSLTLMMAVDLSCSMRPQPGSGLLREVAALAEAAARSAHKAGDRFGLVTFDAGVRGEPRLAPGRARFRATEVAAQLAAWAPETRSAAGLLSLSDYLPERRCLLLLVSDFWIELPALEAALAALARHDVAPVVIEEDAMATWPVRGLVRLEDAETGRRRLVWVRPGLRARAEAAAEARRVALRTVFGRHGRAPFFARGALDIAALGRHLLES